MKDAFHEFVVHGRKDAVNPSAFGTKAAAHYSLNVPAGGTVALRMRLTAAAQGSPTFPDGGFRDFDEVFAARIREADEFYETRYSPAITAEQRKVARQSYAGLLWSKQFYHYIVREWLHGRQADAAPAARTAERAQQRLAARFHRTM